LADDALIQLSALLDRLDPVQRVVERGRTEHDGERIRLALHI
jgi:hypothetical protein